MLKANRGLYIIYITRDGNYFDELLYISRKYRVAFGRSGVVYDLDKIDFSDVGGAE